ncbi:MAG: aldo/keto reductase [Leptospiraceae bacterium]|nr:aldo/keto reductase [Leptospiraceae bacterium]
MLERKIPSSGVNIPIIGLGTWKTFDKAPSIESLDVLKNIVLKFYEIGGRLIDTSPMYGLAEENIGRIVSFLNFNNLLYATKVWTSGKDAGIKQIEESFTKMKVSYIELFQIHNLVDWKTQIKSLKLLKEKGRIRYIGITHYHSGAFSEMEKIIKLEKIDFIQIPYSIERVEAEESILPLCKDNGIAVLINKPFEEGNLFRKVKNKVLPNSALEIGIKTWAQFFLKYIISNDAVTCVIPATDKLNHLEDNMHAGFGVLPNLGLRKEFRKYFLEL